MAHARQDRDAISVACVLFQFIAVDGRELRFVSEVVDPDLRIEVEDGRDLRTIEVEVDEQRSRPGGQRGSETDRNRGHPVGSR